MNKFNSGDLVRVLDIHYLPGTTESYSVQVKNKKNDPHANRLANFIGQTLEVLDFDKYKMNEFVSQHGCIPVGIPHENIGWWPIHPDNLELVFTV